MGQLRISQGIPGPQPPSQRVLMAGPTTPLREGRARQEICGRRQPRLAINAHGALVMMLARVTSGSKVNFAAPSHQGRAGSATCVLGHVRYGTAGSGTGIFRCRPEFFWRVRFRGRLSPKHPEGDDLPRNPITQARVEIVHHQLRPGFDTATIANPPHPL